MEYLAELERVRAVVDLVCAIELRDARRDIVEGDMMCDETGETDVRGTGTHTTRGAFARERIATWFVMD